MDKLISPDELKQRAQALLKAGKMPALDELLKTISGVREKFSPQIVQARTATLPEDEKLQVPSQPKPLVIEQ